MSNSPSTKAAPRESSYTHEELLECGHGRMFGPGNAQLPLPPMLMFDRIIHISDTGGTYNKGQILAELDITPELWFFGCHFEGDPVMPGCLGLDAMWQLVGFYLGWSGHPGKGRALGVGEVKFTGQVQPGIKAIVIYPMNALASDQARRLAQTIWHDERLRRKVSAGLYVGGSGQHGVADEHHLVDQRQVLRDSPPDILLTNYKMLDYLLMRPKDQGIWRHNVGHPERLRFLVLALGDPTPVLIVVIVLKVWFDLKAHRKERARKGSTPPESAASA